MKNKVTGAGGANTNKNGLPFEKNIKKYKNKTKCVIGTVTYNYLEQGDFKKFMYDIYDDNWGKDFHPDGAYVSDDRKTVFILECKHQNCSGSVDEKLITAPTKLKLYKKKYPSVENFHFAFVLNKWWFGRPEYTGFIKQLEEDGIKFFWVDKREEVKVSINVFNDEVYLELNYHIFDYNEIFNWIYERELQSSKPLDFLSV